MTIAAMKDYFSHRELGVQGAVGEYAILVPLAQREIASTFGISRSYVSRIEKRALEKLRAELEKPVGSGAGQ